jgi:hypothetical protein
MQRRREPGVDVIWNSFPFGRPVIPAKAGIQSINSAFPKVCGVDSRFRGNDCDLHCPCIANDTGTENRAEASGIGRRVIARETRKSKYQARKPVFCPAYVFTGFQRGHWMWWPIFAARRKAVATAAQSKAGFARNS